MTMLATLLAAIVLASPNVTPSPYDESVETRDESSTDGVNDPGTNDSTSGQQAEYRYDPMCSPGDGSDSTCSLAYNCPEGQVRYNIWRRLPGQDWVWMGDDCLGGAPADDETVPAVTAGDVLREVRRLPLPKAQLAIQPSDRTLVNLDTVFSTTAPKFDRTVTILGQRVRIIAKPTRYAWHFGDGATLTTATPGRPYPAMYVTHQYTKAGQTHRPRVDVTFSISYSVDGGPTQSLAQTITTEGPAASLTTREATPVLVD